MWPIYGVCIFIAKFFTPKAPGSSPAQYSMYKRNWPPAQKYAINKKSTIFTQFLWHFVKMTIPWDDHFGKVSSKLGENCGFFIYSIFLGRVSISLGHMYCIFFAVINYLVTYSSLTFCTHVLLNIFCDYCYFYFISTARKYLVYSKKRSHFLIVFPPQNHLWWFILAKFRTEGDMISFLETWYTF